LRVNVATLWRNDLPKHVASLNDRREDNK